MSQSQVQWFEDAKPAFLTRHTLRCVKRIMSLKWIFFVRSTLPVGNRTSTMTSPCKGFAKASVIKRCLRSGSSKITSSKVAWAGGLGRRRIEFLVLAELPKPHMTKIQLDVRLMTSQSVSLTSMSGAMKRDAIKEFMTEKCPE